MEDHVFNDEDNLHYFDVIFVKLSESIHIHVSVTQDKSPESYHLPQSLSTKKFYKLTLRNLSTFNQFLLRLDCLLVFRQNRQVDKRLRDVGSPGIEVWRDVWHTYKHWCAGDAISFQADQSISWLCIEDFYLLHFSLAKRKTVDLCTSSSINLESTARPRVDPAHQHQLIWNPLPRRYIGTQVETPPIFLGWCMTKHVYIWRSQGTSAWVYANVVAHLIVPQQIGVQAILGLPWNVSSDR